MLLLCGCAREQEQAATVPADTTAAAVTGPKACDLLTAEDITRVIGVNVDAGVVINDYMGVSQCQYNRAGTKDGVVMVSLHEHGEILNYQKVPGSATVAGVGDAAVWNPQTGQLAVKRGEAVISISFLTPSSSKSSAVDLAGVALAKFAR